MSIPVVTITSSGIVVPSFADVLGALQSLYRAIYGADIIISADSQDGQFLSAMAQAMSDVNQNAADVYNSFSPLTAQGVTLDQRVAINGIVRDAATHSTAVVTITGQNGTTIAAGTVVDLAGNSWDLPAVVSIGGSGTVDVTATAQEPGAIAAAPHAISVIGSPTRGWQGVDNAAAATQGAPVESDAALRRRQQQSVSLPAEAIVPAIQAAVESVAGVQRAFVYENDTDSTDGDGIPAHSISAVVGGGDAMAVAEAIASRKPPGVQTYGSTTETVNDSRGVPRDINFYTLAAVPLTVDITVTALPGWAVSTEDLIAASVAAFINGLDIGEDSFLNRMFAPANLSGPYALAATGLTQAELSALAMTFNVNSIEQSKTGTGGLAAADLTIDFNQATSSAAASPVDTPANGKVSVHT